MLVAGLTWISLIISGNAMAIDPEGHLHVTRSSLAVYAKCLDQIGVTDELADGHEAIAYFSAEEDLSPLLRRIFNWHFFDFYRDDETHAMGRYFTGARMSLHSIFDAHADDLKQALLNVQNSAVHELTGRILHYMQDVTVPAHVAPIFHFKFKFLGRADYFDQMPVGQTQVISYRPDLCLVKKSEVTSLQQGLDRILTTTALDTRRRIEQPIPVPETHALSGKTWEEFWVLRNPRDDDQYEGTTKGFAPYGNRGREGFEKLCKGSEPEREACLNFFRQSYQTAVIATVETLLLINSQMVHE